ncbi:DUF6624 domain-containing protein [Streptomyces sp. NPDC055992]|uniref:DUF6624 domain-containing protein n=1 Tax=Streptomyces sp. NPDC055992 TaxID=3345673 RepID=UPI0035D6B9B1
MPTEPRHPHLARELIHHAAGADAHWYRLARLPAQDQLIGTGRHTDHVNAGFLKGIIVEYGWPDVPLVGRDGATAAWRIALHCDPRTDIQGAALREMHRAVQRGTASVRQWAHLHDRYALNTGSLQDYGTQYRLGPHGPERHPVRDPDELDTRRRQVELPLAADALRHLRQRLAASPRGAGEWEGAPAPGLAGVG